jgi:hypothetical protein
MDKRRVRPIPGLGVAPPGFHLRGDAVDEIDRRVRNVRARKNLINNSTSVCASFVPGGVGKGLE